MTDSWLMSTEEASGLPEEKLPPHLRGRRVGSLNETEIRELLQLKEAVDSDTQDPLVASEDGS
jgi:hypothetical protein